jgi:membrane protein DedA with SNARE-associated domain
VDLTAFLAAIPPVLVYVFIALLIGIESIGVPLPGETALVGATLLSLHPQSQINPWVIAASAMIGAAIGDSIGYAVGNRYGARLLRRLSEKFPRHFTPAHIRYAEHVFARWGVWAVFFGRFIALLRILAGPLSGALKIEYRRFLMANVSGAFVWAFGTVWFIVAVGEAAHLYLKEFAWVGFGVVILGAVVAGSLLNRRIQENVRRFAAEEAAALESAPNKGD